MLAADNITYKFRELQLYGIKTDRIQQNIPGYVTVINRHPFIGLALKLRYIYGSRSSVQIQG
jgi:hypothetical protein